MRKILLMRSVSVDGFFEGPNRELDWHMVDDERHSHFSEQLSAMGTFLNGRVTYALVVRFWPTADTDPSSPGPMVEFARSGGTMPPRRSGSSRHSPGGDLVLGEADLAAVFMRHDLIDEYRLYVHRIVIGQGKPLFQPSDAKMNLQLAETRTFGNGDVLLRYSVDRQGNLD